MRLTPLLRLLPLLLVALLARAGEMPAALASLDQVVARTRAEFQVPGIAVAIVKDGEVLLERGYGVLEVGKPDPVDARTLFAIASNTKAFTAASLALLVDEGKLKWSDRVIDHLPWFRMSDPYVTTEMTVEDLLTHRSGLALGAGDLLFWPPTDLTTREVVEHLRRVPLATSFRSAYAYDNILYAVAELVIEQASGQRWGDFVRQRIFFPVGMADSRTSSAQLRPGDNAAIGHALHDFKDLHPVPAQAWDNNQAAGNIVSSAHDMALWMRVQLAGGRLPGDGDRKVFARERQAEMWRMVTPRQIRPSKVAALRAVQPNFLGYGLGWDLSDYRGRKVVSHTGGWPGQVSKVTLVPEIGLGVVVLTNQEAGGAFQAVSAHVVDAFLGASGTDWVATYAELRRNSQSEADDSWAKLVAARAADSRPSLPLAAYAGTYRDAWRGDVAIAEEAGRLVLRFSRTGALVGDLEHWQHDSFIVRWRDRALNADAFITFSLTPEGRVEQAKMKAVSPLTDFSFDFHHLVLVRQAKP